MKVTIKWANPEKDGAVRAICNVEVMENSLTLYGVKIVRGRSGNLFVASQSIKDKHGKYYPTTYIGNELCDSIIDLTKKAMKDYHASKKIESIDRQALAAEINRLLSKEKEEEDL